MIGFDAIVRREILLSGAAGRTFRILTLNAAFPLNQQAENHLLKERDEACKAKKLLLVIAESEVLMKGNAITDFINETLNIYSPYFYTLSCYAHHGFKTTIDGECFEDLSRVLRDIYTGKLRYDGLVTGRQTLYIESMQDDCWKCYRALRTVTGLVFPDQEPRSKADRQWRYYNDLLSLDRIPEIYLPSIQIAAAQLRETNPRVTPVEYRFSQSVQASYWAAVCPFCTALLGSFYVGEKRMDYLHELNSRQSKLQYHPIYLDINQELIQSLGAGTEISPPSLFMGWRRNCTS